MSRKNARHDSHLQGLLAQERSPFSPSFFLCRSVGRESDGGNAGSKRIERGVRAGPGQVQGYTPAGNNERNQCCTAPLRRQSNGRRVRATTPLAPIAFCRPLVPATATTEAGGGKSYIERAREREGEHVAGSTWIKRKR